MDVYWLKTVQYGRASNQYACKLVDLLTGDELYSYSPLTEPNLLKHTSLFFVTNRNLDECVTLDKFLPKMDFLRSTFSQNRFSLFFKTDQLQLLFEIPARPESCSV